MPNSETRRLQDLGIARFNDIFPRIVNGNFIEIDKEWVPFDRLPHPTISSPIIDIAVGPFAKGDTRYDIEYNNLIRNVAIWELLSRAEMAHMENLRLYNIPAIFDNFRNGEFTNENARCFMAVEIEGRKDRKVVLADIINTSAMGRIGIIVAKSDEVLKIFVRLLNYLLFLQSVGKPTFITKNVLILKREQYEDVLSAR